MKFTLSMIAAALALAAGAQNAENAPVCPQEARAAGAGESMNFIVHAVQNPRIAEKIGLGKEQIEQLKSLKTDRKADKELHEKIRQGMEKQAELLKAEQIDEAAVMSTMDQIWETRKEVAKRQTQRVIAVKKVLTAEQIEKARNAMKELRAARGKDCPNGGRRIKGKGRRAPGICPNEEPKADAEEK